MNKGEIKALQMILEYLSDEKEDFESQGNPENHIYLDMQVLEKYLYGEGNS